MSDPFRSPKLRAWHLDRSAFVYVRQSTPQQVSDHQESTARQYALAGRAVDLGWVADRITIIDDDLGKSGQSIEGRPGFQRLLAEVALDHVGLILWRRPNRTTLCNLLHHPCYAGAYRFGHRQVDPRGKLPGRRATGRKSLPPEECLVLIRDRLPAYITWDRFRANQDRLKANRARQDRPGAPRQGHSLLAGLLRCGRCGRRMIVLYSGPKDLHAYTCTRGPTGTGEPLCQSLPDPVLDGLVAGRVLAAVEPAALEASLAAVAGVERERIELTRHWQLRRERADYEVDRAARQYQACEPENRLVGRDGTSLGGIAEGAEATRGGVRAMAADGPRSALTRR